jgi:RNA polymerase sigma factor (sigma-70 family)
MAVPVEGGRLEELYLQHGRPAFRLACLLTGDEQEAQDIAQEAFVRLGGRLVTLLDPDRAAGYLYRTIANLSRDHGRRLRRDRSLRDRLRSPERPVSSELGDRDEVWRALMRLSIRHRTVLFLRYYLDMSEASAANALELSVPATKSATNRAAKALRAELGGQR